MRKHAHGNGGVCRPVMRRISYEAQELQDALHVDPGNTISSGQRLSYQLSNRPAPLATGPTSSRTSLKHYGFTAYSNDLLATWPPAAVNPYCRRREAGLITRVSKLVWKTSANYKVVPIVDESIDPHVVISKDQAVQGVVA